MGDAGRRDHPHRLAELGLRLVLLGRARARACAASPAAYLGSRGGLGTYTKCAIKLAALAGPAGAGAARGRRPATACRSRRTSAPTPSARPTGTRGRSATTRSTTTGSATSSTASSTWPAPTWPPRLWLTYIDPTKTLNDVETAAKDPGDPARSPREARISFQLILAGRTRSRASSFRTRFWTPSSQQTGCYKVKRFCEQDMAEFTNMYMQRLGHKHCNFIWVGGYMGSWMQAGHARLREEVCARGDRRLLPRPEEPQAGASAAATP